MAPEGTILQRRASWRAGQRERLRLQTRAQLANALRELIPGQPVRIFGSLAVPGHFHERSDIDLALETEPVSMTRLSLMGHLEERLGRPVEVLLLAKCRFKRKILSEGELWTS
mgnify:CR=1 FL=1